MMFFYFVKSISRKFREIDTLYFIFTLLSLLLWSSVDWAKTSVQVWQSLNLCHLFCRTTANNKTQHQNQLCNFESWCFGFRKCSEVKTIVRPMPTINWCLPSTNFAICIQIGWKINNTTNFLVAWFFKEYKRENNTPMTPQTELFDSWKMKGVFSGSKKIRCDEFFSL